MDFDFSLALIGLPNAGKSVIFHLLTGMDSEIGPNALTTIRPIQGVVDWQDIRMKSIAEIIHPDQIFPLKIQIVDTQGIYPEKENNLPSLTESLSYVRGSDVLCHIIRIFNNPSISYATAKVDPNEDASLPLNSLCEIDAELIENRLTKINRLLSKGSKDLEVLFENNLLLKVQNYLLQKRPLSSKVWEEK